MKRIPVYFMPGLAASTSIFERIVLPEDQFEIVLLEWIIPIPNESISDYVIRLSTFIQHDNPVLIGVSFGGVIVQEMAKVIRVRKTIIISSVKSNKEFPRRLKIAKSTKVYKLLPTGLVQNVEVLSKFAYGDTVKQRLKLYDRYLCVRDKCYLDWAIETIIHWNRTEPDPSVIHIHGDADDVFPIKYIKNSMVVKGGTHIMILNKFRWLNENLPKIILNPS